MHQQKIEKRYLVLSLLNSLLVSKFGQDRFEIEARLLCTAYDLQG
jgi:hypothetical protein